MPSIRLSPRMGTSTHSRSNCTSPRSSTRPRRTSASARLCPTRVSVCLTQARMCLALVRAYLTLARVCQTPKWVCAFLSELHVSKIFHPPGTDFCFCEVGPHTKPGVSNTRLGVSNTSPKFGGLRDQICTTQGPEDDFVR